LPGEVVAKRLGARISEQPPHLAFEDLGLAQLPLDSDVQEPVVGNAAPKEERQPGGELHVTDGVGRARRNGGGIALDPEEERGADEKSLQTDLNAPLEAPLGASVLVERHQRFEVLFGYGAS